MKATPKKKVVNKVKTSRQSPTLRAKKAVKLALENGGNVSKAMREAGYSEAMAKNPQKLTQSKAWNDIMEEVFPDNFIVEQHRKLFESRQLDYFVFSKSMLDEEIRQHVEAAGLSVIVIRASDKGKMAFYSTPNDIVRQKALADIYKIKGRYAPEKVDHTTLGKEIQAITGVRVIIEK